MEWIVFTSAFAASFVECVEAFTIVLVVGMTINWRSALVGTGAALLILAALVGIFGVALVQWVPLDVLRLVVGAILILFGLKWLKKAILRYAGLKALHDEEAIYEHELAETRECEGIFRFLVRKRCHIFEYLHCQFLLDVCFLRDVVRNLRLRHGLCHIHTSFE
jgi:uncharacterized membrane protein